MMYWFNFHISCDILLRVLKQKQLGDLIISIIVCILKWPRKIVFSDSVITPWKLEIIRLTQNNFAYLYDIRDQIRQSLIHFDLLCVFFDLVFHGLQLVRDSQHFTLHDLWPTQQVQGQQGAHLFDRKSRNCNSFWVTITYFYFTVQQSGSLNYLLSRHLQDLLTDPILRNVKQHHVILRSQT